MAPKINNKGRNKEIGDSNSEKKKKTHRAMCNKKLFIYLVFEQKLIGNIAQRCQRRMSKCIESFKEVAKCLIDQGRRLELRKSRKLPFTFYIKWTMLKMFF